MLKGDKRVTRAESAKKNSTTSEEKAPKAQTKKVDSKAAADKKRGRDEVTEVTVEVESFKVPEPKKAKATGKKAGKKAAAAETKKKVHIPGHIDNLGELDDSSADSSSELSFSEDPSTGSEANLSDVESSSIDEFATGALEIKIDDELRDKINQRVLKAAKKSEVNPARGVVFLSHIPYGFFEPAMKKFFEQFGDVTRVRLSRSKRTGNSKGYAYIEFEEPEVAKIVAETMNNYLMYGRKLVSEYVPAEKLHPKVWKGAGEKFRQVPWVRINRLQHNKRKSPKDHKREIDTLVKKEDKKRKQLAEMGIDYEFPGYKAAVELLQEKEASWNKTNSSLETSEDSAAQPPKTKKAKNAESSDAEVAVPVTKAAAPAKGKAATPSKVAASPAEKRQTPTRGKK